MSGVNWMRLNLAFTSEASVLSASVLAKPGTPSSKMWPFTISEISKRSTKSFWPIR